MTETEKLFRELVEQIQSPVCNNTDDFSSSAASCGFSEIFCQISKKINSKKKRTKVVEKAVYRYKQEHLIFSVNSTAYKA